MEILYLGHSSFLLKNKEVKVVCDPFGKSTGFNQAKVGADIVTISHNQHDDHKDLSLVDGEYMVIDGPGEYEIKEVSITGISSFHDNKEGKERGKNTIYVFDIDELRVCHLGDLGHSLNEKQLKQIGSVDILLVPVGGEFTINPEQAKKVVDQVEPSIVIPMHFKTKEHNKKYESLKPVGAFVEEMGMERKNEAKLKIKKLDLPEEMELIILSKYGR
jgi:L-ascorbate metabolism protein UlaG (beta-lactamase superfamily)